MSKSELRQQVLKSRRSIPKDKVLSRSESVGRRLLVLPEYQTASTIATYVAKSDEVQTAAIINRALADGKRVLVPRSDPASTALVFAEIRSMAELSVGHFGILEPAAGSRHVPLDEADIVLVPIVAWDQEGHRIGYGRGYFDRALGTSRSSITVGLAFESQNLAKIPRAPTDVPLDIIVTEERVLRFGRGKN